METQLIKKVSLTQDVYELHYKLPEAKNMKPGQFITFILPWIWGRSYSILELQWDIAILIIKKWESKDGWRGWSIALCDANEWDVFKAVGPAGHFVLQENDSNKLFLGTGTGLVPLYNMILEGLKNKSKEKFQLVFGVRYMEDLFYVNKFEDLKKIYPNNFYYHLVVSRSEADWIIKKWYVTDFLSEKVVWDYTEFYICWAPAMIESCEEKLEKLWVKQENIYFEKYS